MYEFYCPVIASSLIQYDQDQAWSFQQLVSFFVFNIIVRVWECRVRACGGNVNSITLLLTILSHTIGQNFFMYK